MEFEQDKTQLAQTHSQLTDELLSKGKKERKEAVDRAQTQIRSEFLNKMAELRNEHARLEAEWQRERSRFEQAKQDALDKMRSEFEMNTYD